MAKWGKCDFAQLKKLTERMERLSEVDFDSFCTQTAKELAGRLLNKVKKRTPVGVPPSWIQGEAAKEYWAGYTGGSLRDNWSILPIERRGDDYIVTVVNNLNYASYVEYGHRQQVGRQVGVIERRLKTPWVPGKHMLTISTQELETQAPALVEKKLYRFLKGCLDAQ